MRRDWGLGTFCGRGLGIIKSFRLGLALCLLLLPAGAAAAQGGYDLTWWTVDGGGGMVSAGPGYSLGGTIGQPDAGAMSGPGYTLAGGFWQQRAGLYRFYLPLAVRG